MTAPRIRTAATTLRRGFSLVEIMLVVVIIGTLATMSAPKIARARDQYSVKAAQARVAAAVATARASAMHTGRESLFLVSGQWISVWSKNPTTGVWQQQVQWQNIGEVHNNVQIQVGGSGWNYVWFEPRGLTMYKPPSTTVFRIVGKTSTDSVCISRLGQILPNRCAL